MMRPRCVPLPLLCLLVLQLCNAFPALSAESSPALSVEARLEQLESRLPVINSGDNAWLLVSSALVLMMTAPGLILFYGGLVRQKNVLATMMHGLADRTHLLEGGRDVEVGSGQQVAQGGSLGKGVAAQIDSGDHVANSLRPGSGVVRAYQWLIQTVAGIGRSPSRGVFGRSPGGQNSGAIPMSHGGGDG